MVPAGLLHDVRQLQSVAHGRTLCNHHHRARTQAHELLPRERTTACRSQRRVLAPGRRGRVRTKQQAQDYWKGHRIRYNTHQTRRPTTVACQWWWV
jgi:hypothetical protein